MKNPAFHKYLETGEAGGPVTELLGPEENSRELFMNTINDFLSDYGDVPDEDVAPVLFAYSSEGEEAGDALLNALWKKLDPESWAEGQLVPEKHELQGKDTGGLAALLTGGASGSSGTGREATGPSGGPVEKGGPKDGLPRKADGSLDEGAVISRALAGTRRY
jgi:hypothetical protein